MIGVPATAALVTRLRATFQFRIGELLVRMDELGTAHTLSDDPLVCPVVPSADELEDWLGPDSPFSGNRKGSPDEPPELVGVRHVRVTVDFLGDLSALSSRRTAIPSGQRSARSSSTTRRTPRRALAIGGFAPGRALVETTTGSG